MRRGYHKRNPAKPPESRAKLNIVMPNGEKVRFNGKAKCRHCGDRGCPKRWCERCEAVTGYECKPCHDEMVHGVTFLPGNAKPPKLHSYTRRA